jgi:hypothetical protein
LITGIKSQNPLNTIRNSIHGDHKMAQLSSPGVSVTVIDESFYTSAAPGTTPLIIVASEQDKANSSNTGTAQGTTKANAGKVYLVTSQKDLADTFGTPTFKTDANNNPIHAGEQNEYGLQAAYSYLGVSNRAYVVRADIDTAELEAQADAPTGSPADGQLWFDTSSTKFGIFQWNSSAATTTSGQTFSNKVPLVITSSDSLTGGAPNASIGAIGDYALVSLNSEYTLWFKKAKTNTAAGIWVEVGSTAWIASWPSAQGSISSPTLLSGDTLTITVNGQSNDYTGHTGLSTLVTDINTVNQGVGDETNSYGITAAIVNNRLELYSTGTEFTVSGTSVAKLGLIPLATDPVTYSSTGTFKAPALNIQPHFSVPTFKRTENSATVQGYPTGSVWIKTSEPNLGARWRVKIYNEATASWTEKSAPLYATSAAALKGLDAGGGGLNLTQNALYVKHNIEEQLTPTDEPVSANFKIYARKSAGATEISSKTTFAAFTAVGSNSFTIQETVKGQTQLSDALTVEFTGRLGAGTELDPYVTNIDGFVSALTAKLGDATLNGTPITSRITVTKTTTGNVVIRHNDGGDIHFTDSTGSAIEDLFTPYTVDGNGVGQGTANFYTDIDQDHDFVASLWSPYADIATSADAPTTEAEDGRLWYSSMVDEVDILVNNGVTWVGYKYAANSGLSTVSSPYYSAVDADRTDPKGPIVSATKPKAQSDGTALVTGDLWIDTSDLENYPSLYKYNKNLGKWIAVDTGDQTTEDGIIFADARWAVDGGTADAQTDSTIEELLVSDFLDPDAPDPALYPRGMLLWNLRRSGFNVKRFVRDSIDVLADNPRQGDTSMSDYYPHRWVTESGNQENGAGTFGRKSQRKVVIQALQSLVNSNQQLRDEESRVFNLIACPGYPELIGEMINLNYDRGLTAFVVGDTPARLTPDATSLNNWGKNVAGAVEDNDVGLVSSDEYFGVFYPWGFTSDNIGNNIVVPPSHMILRTIALNDQVSYPWFAPAGTRRGGITNATAVGYVTSEGEFQSVSLNTGQRDTLADSKINPITFITGTGLVNYGQYTRAKNASALDRINVARLVIFLRRQFALLAKPYVFEPNDKITRDELKGAAESLLLELVGQRALYDYIVVCDTSNNTPARIDRNELYLDVAIEPVKAVEFIYIPLRLKNTGEIKGLA